MVLFRRGAALAVIVVLLVVAPALSLARTTDHASPADADATVNAGPGKGANGVEPDRAVASGARPYVSNSGNRRDLPHNLSPVGMFMGADIVVKIVMAGLALASLMTWIIWLAKSLELAGARLRARRVLKIVSGSKTLDEAARAVEGRRGPAALMLKAAMEEIEASDTAIDHAGGEGLKERVSSALGRIEAHGGRRMSRGTGILATIGSTAPFVGLFGTVWGIMNAFIGISQAETTNLAVVAPGIAEALLATATGLVAAIPAVVIYNVFARSVAGYRHLLGDAASGVERLVSRDLDFRKLPARDTGETAGDRPDQAIHAIPVRQGVE